MLHCLTLPYAPHPKSANQLYLMHHNLWRLVGREDREGFGAASGLRKKKTGGTSNREKAKKKNMPAAARVRQISRRAKDTKRKGKGFKGHVKGGNFDRSR